MADFDKFPEAFNAFGIKFSEEPGWRTRGHGDINDVKFLVIHHTAGGGDAGDIRIVRDGRSDLPGPLSQLVFKRDGTPHIIAQGVSWHAYGNINFKGVPAKSGNYWSIGIEGVSNGYNDWTEAQRREYPRIVAALLKYKGLPADAWIFHRDYQPGEKIDPAGFDKDWFGRQVTAYYNGGGTPAVVPTAIEAKRAEAVNAFLGNKLMAEKERPTADGVGRYTDYQNGYIYWHPNLGAKVVRREIFTKYEAMKWEQGPLGYPTGDTITISGGFAQSFQNASIYFNAKTNEGFVLGGAIGSRWAELNWELGPLGFPQTDEISLPDQVGKLQRFEKGHIYHHPTTGAKEIFYGPMWEEFARLDYEKGPLGYPVGTPVSSQDRRGTVQGFQKGTIYSLDGRGKEDGNGLWGEIFGMYARLGYENGRLGFPITDVYSKDGKDRVDFEAGSIELDPKDNSIYLVLSGKRVDIPLAEPTVPSKPSRPTDQSVVGKFVLDFSAAQVPAKDIKAGGYIGVIHYVSDKRPDAGWMQAKPVTKWYANNLKSNGLFNVSNFQFGKGSTSDWRKGYANGVACAKRALELHKAAGGPDGAVIYASIDDDPTSNEQTDLIKPYLEGWQSVIGKERLGVYANPKTIDFCLKNGLGSYFWQHEWDGVKGVGPHHPAACLHQVEIDKTVVGGVTIDKNIVLKPDFGQW